MRIGRSVAATRPLVAEALAVPISPSRRLLVRVGWVVAAVAGVAAIAAVIAALIPAPAPARSPFGAGFREATPSAQGLGAILLALQARFSLALQEALAAFKRGESGAALFVALAFAYGVFHAAGPGHGKAVIAAYLASGRAGLRRGVAISAGAALVQAAIALALVGTVALVLKGTAATVDAAALFIERSGFILITLLAAWVLWRKAGALSDPPGTMACDCEGACGHSAAFAAVAARTRGSAWREWSAVALAAGARPCSGAVILLFFAMSQGLAWAGVAAVIAMAVGTAVTTSLIAGLTVSAKALAVRLSGRGGRAQRALAVAELVAAAVLLVLSATLLLGSWQLRTFA